MISSVTLVVFFLMIRRPPRSTRTDNSFPTRRSSDLWGILVLPLAAWMAILFAFPGYRETHALFDDGPNHLHYLVPFFTGWLLRVRPVDRKSTRLNSSH